MWRRASARGDGEDHKLVLRSCFCDPDNIFGSGCLWAAIIMEKPSLCGMAKVAYLYSHSYLHWHHPMVYILSDFRCIAALLQTIGNNAVTARMPSFPLLWQ